MAEEHKVGYKVWKIRLDPAHGKHNLVSPHQAHVWTPGENLSSGAGTPLEEWGGTSRGFYSSKTPEQMIQNQYYPIKDDLGTAGHLMHYGKVTDATQGWRSEKALVAGIYEEGDTEDSCQVCKRNPADRLLAIGEGRDNISVCKDCARRIKLALKKAEELSKHEMYTGLAKHYDVPLMEPLPQMKEARRRK